MRAVEGLFVGRERFGLRQEPFRELVEADVEQERGDAEVGQPLAIVAEVGCDPECQHPCARQVRSNVLGVRRRRLKA